MIRIANAVINGTKQCNKVVNLGAVVTGRNLSDGKNPPG